MPTPDANDQFIAAVPSFPRRFISDDIAGNLAFEAVADWFVRTYEGDSPFIRDLQRQVLRGSMLTPRQQAGALNVLREERRWSARA